MMQLTEACPRFQKCAVNNCPLHTGYQGLLEPVEDDAEKRCRLSKLKRLRVVARYPEAARRLPLGGLTPREASGAKIEAALTPEQRKARAEKLAALANFRRLPALSEGTGAGTGTGASGGAGGPA